MADMADSASAFEIESDTDSIKMSVPKKEEELLSRNASLEQENKVLKIELETYKMCCKCKALQVQGENRDLNLMKGASVNRPIQAQVEQEEEFISNTLLKKIQALKKEKEKLAVNYEQEEEFLTNDLSRKLVQLRQEKHQLERTLEQEQEYQVNKLMRKIERLENDTVSKQKKVEELRQEKVDLEKCVEQEQEALVNRLWKRMDRLEAEKRILQEKLDEPVSAPTSPREIKNGNTSDNLTITVEQLRSEVKKLKGQLMSSQIEHEVRMALLVQEERELKGENLRLQRKLLLGQERREALSRHLSESESNLEMEDERQFDEIVVHDGIHPRPISSPIPYSPNPNRPLSPDEEKMTDLVQEEGEFKEENLHPKALSRHLSESETSLEMDDERQFNEIVVHDGIHPRPISSPIPYSPNSNRPISPETSARNHQGRRHRRVSSENIPGHNLVRLESRPGKSCYGRDCKECALAGRKRQRPGPTAKSQKIRNVTTRYGCAQCMVPLCRASPYNCFTSYHNRGAHDGL